MSVRSRRKLVRPVIRALTALDPDSQVRLRPGQAAEARRLADWAAKALAGAPLPAGSGDDDARMLLAVHVLDAIWRPAGHQACRVCRPSRVSGGAEYRRRLLARQRRRRSR